MRWQTDVATSSLGRSHQCPFDPGPPVKTCIIPRRIALAANVFHATGYRFIQALIVAVEDVA
jgi:hypothetical protein